MMDFDFLKPQFEDQVTANINDAGDIVVASSTFSPIQILRNIEPTTYNIAFQDWKQNYFQECIERANEIIENLNDRNRFLRLQETINLTDSVIPFVGAGMSCSSGFRTWAAYLHFLRLDSELSEADLNELLNQGLYEVAAERLLESLGEHLFNERMRTTYRTFRATNIKGPVNYLPSFFKRAVVTTNFDDVLEQVYRAQNNSFAQTLYGRRDAGFIRNMADNIFCLYKIHGDFSNPSTRVLTTAEYNQVYEDNTSLVTTLKRMLSSNTFLFLGCSLNQDRTMQLMQALAHEDLPDHFALLSDPGDETARREKTKFLSMRKIFPIWYPTNQHDSSIEAIFVKLLSDRNLL